MALVHLGDRCIVPELERREQKTTRLFSRLKLAVVLHRLGNSQPPIKLAGEITQGKEPQKPLPLVNAKTLSDMWSPRNLEEGTFFQTLINARLPETDQALMAMTKPHHPLYPYLASRFTCELRSRNEEYLGRPYCLSFLLEVLKDTTPAQVSYRIKNDNIIADERHSRSMGSLHGELQQSTKGLSRLKRDVVICK